MTFDRCILQLSAEAVNSGSMHAWQRNQQNLAGESRFLSKMAPLPGNTNWVYCLLLQSKVKTNSEVSSTSKQAVASGITHIHFHSLRSSNTTLH